MISTQASIFQKYVQKRHNTAAQYIPTRLILDLFKNMVRRTGKWVARRWWEKKVLDLASARAAVEAAAAADK